MQAVPERSPIGVKNVNPPPPIEDITRIKIRFSRDGHHIENNVVDCPDTLIEMK